MSGSTRQQHVPDMPDSPRRVETLGADIHTILDAVTAEHAERVVQLGQALVGGSVPGIRQEAVGLQQA